MRYLIAITLQVLMDLNYISCTRSSGSSKFDPEAATILQSYTSEDIYQPSYSLSPTDLLYLTNLEKDLFPIVKQYVLKLETQPQHFFKRYIADYETSSLVAFKFSNGTKTKEKNFIHANPLWLFRMIWRFVKDFPKIRNVIIANGDAEILAAFKEVSPTSIGWPNQQDLRDIMDNILNMQHTYDLNLAEFTNGIILNVVTNANLSAIHCYAISKYAMRNKNQYTLALEWLKIAEKKSLDTNGHPILDRIEMSSIQKLLQNITKEHDAVWRKERPLIDNLFKFVTKIDSGYNLTSQKTMLQLRHKTKGLGAPYASTEDVAAFSTLCKGGNLQTEKEKSGLYCWYESKMNAAWYINPQKMELYSQDPYIFQVYDFIGENLMKYLKNEAIPFIERSESRNIYSKIRTSMYAWLTETKHGTRLSTLSKRIGLLTGLIPSWSERMRTNSILLAVYAAGGYFQFHLDSHEGTETFKDIIPQNIGDRLATFMLYLNDVTLGGSTAFTTAGVAVPPVKGSGLFWYNCKYNGEMDYKTLHGGCPVLLGEKWVANKWIYNNLNIFSRKCSLNKNV